MARAKYNARKQKKADIENEKRRDKRLRRERKEKKSGKEKKIGKQFHVDKKTGEKNIVENNIVNQPKETQQKTIELNQPKENKPKEKDLSLLQKFIKPQIFRDLEDKGQLHAGTVPLGVGGGFTGAELANKISETGKIKVGYEAMASIKNKLLAQSISKTLGTFGKGQKSAVIGQSLKFTSKTAPEAMNFATNTKTIGLTKKLLIGAGISLGVVSIAKDILGTYPFASFGKEETLQSISFAMNAAIKEGLYEEAQGLLNASNEMINASPEIISKIPYANVQKEFKNFATQQAKNNKVWELVIDKQIKELENEDSKFEQDNQKFKDIAEERKQSKLKEQELDSQYFALIRERKYDEAEELLQSRIEGEA